jgi:hypothetical protein
MKEKKQIGMWLPIGVMKAGKWSGKNIKMVDAANIKNIEDILTSINPVGVYRVREKRRVITRRKCQPQIKRKNSVDDIVEFWNKQGKPFAKCRPNSARTLEAKKVLEKLYRKHRSGVYSVIGRAHKHLNAYGFRYKPVNNISLLSFLKPSPQERARIKLYRLTPSLWKLFLENENLDQFYYQKKDKNPDLTIALIREIEVDEITSGIRNSCAMAAEMVIKFADKNDLDVMTVVKAIGRIMKQNKWLEPRSVKSDMMWNELIPKELIRYGVFRSRREIND